MLRTSPSLLQDTLEQLQQATLDHAVWRDHLVRVISGRQPCDPQDMAVDAHRHCSFGQWYFDRALPELRDLPSFAMIGAEHESQHLIAARLLRGLAAGDPITRSTIEEFEEASARLSYALYFIRREIECSLHGRDALTEAHSPGEMLRDLREWHALARQPGRQCCIALMELDDVRQINATHGYSVGAQALVNAVKIVAMHLRLSDKVFRYNGSKFLLRLSGTDLAPGRTVVMRLRDAVASGLSVVGADEDPVHVTASFGLALLDPDVEVLESIDRADQALTLAKTAGGNRIITWDPSITTGVRLRRLEVKEVPR
ncbi:MAG TPA: diguanylate cyclase [Steroidobacteraceae bacterium]|nr:diguanylate cyclase [Steroidobacteraceae bacterium]